MTQKLRHASLIVFTILMSISGFSQDSNSWIEAQEKSNPNFHEIQKKFYKHWKDKDLKDPNVSKGKGYKVFKRWENFWGHRLYPNGDLNQMKSMAMENLSGSTASKSSGSSWSLLGPTVIGGTVSNGSYQSPGGSGRVNIIAVDPTNSSIIYVGTPAGGIWKSTDAGNSWFSLMATGANIGVSCIVVDYSNPNVIYIGTGDRDARDTYSVGILKSTDAGNTWQPTSLSFDVSQGKSISKIIQHPSNPNELLVSTLGSGAIYKTTNGFVSHTIVNSGTTWDLEYHPTNPNVVYAAGYFSYYRSTDGGNTWSNSSAGLPVSTSYRSEIAVSPDAPNNVYYVSGGDSSNDYGFGGFYVSNDSGASYSVKHASRRNTNLLGWNTGYNDAGGQGWYDLTLAVNPTNANEIFLGGVNLSKSTDGGSSWSVNGYWLEGSSYNYIHADHHYTFYTSDGTLYDGNDGGIVKSTNGGNTWTDISNNMSIAQIAGLGASGTDASLIITGMQDNGTNIFRNGSWTITGGGDGGECMIDPSNSQKMYRSYVNGTIYRSTNGGDSWSSMKPTGAGTGAWVSPMVLDPNTPSTIYAGYGQLWKSTNSGVNWSQLGTSAGSGTIVKIAVAPSNTNYIYILKEYYNSTAGNYEFTMLKSTNAGSSWSVINNNAPVTVAAPREIAVSDTDPNKIWCVFSGYTDGEKVYASSDGGSSWVNVSNNIPNTPVTAIAYENGSNNKVYIGTDSGIFYTDDSLTEWVGYNDGIPAAPITELEIYYDANPANSLLRAATYGRSLWEVPLANTVASSCSATANVSVTNITETEATVNWDAVTDAQSYTYRYRTSGVSTWTSGTTTQLSVVLSGLNSGASYEVEISTNCSSGSSAYTNTVNFATVSTGCDIPINLTASDITTNSATLNWNAVANAVSYTIQLREAGTTVWTDLNSSTNTVSASNLTAATSYEFQVSTVCSSGSSDYSTISVFTTEDEPVTAEYCASTSTNSDSWIDYISLGSISNSSGYDNGYADNTTMSTDLTAGSSETITFSCNYSGKGKPKFYWDVWIDFNQNGVFDSGENLVHGYSNNLGNLSATISIPTSAISGTTRMRITVKKDTYANACETFASGEVEDYTINIVGGNGIVEQTVKQAITLTEIVPEFVVYPTVTSHTLTIKGLSNITSFKIYNAGGARTAYGKLNNNTIDVSSLPAGMYLLQFSTNEKSYIQRFIKK
ncbi:exported hypothetical protein [Tenacibaculum sediminilitoris]|uniref:GEVED domain-containing protein n=1 Tax=Tenacibaculum sediminilitoris TaxID=1820334 RepID=UPI0038938753